MNNNWEKIKGFITKKGVLARKVIDEIEFSFAEGIIGVKDALEKYDCVQNINEKVLKGVLKDMESFFEQLIKNERLMSGKSKNSDFSFITPQNFEQRCWDIKTKMMEWVSKVIKEVKEKKKQSVCNSVMNSEVYTKNEKSVSTTP